MTLRSKSEDSQPKLTEILAELRAKLTSGKLSISDARDRATKAIDRKKSQIKNCRAKILRLCEHVPKLEELWRHLERKDHANQLLDLNNYFPNCAESEDPRAKEAVEPFQEYVQDLVWAELDLEQWRNFRDFVEVLALKRDEAPETGLEGQPSKTVSAQNPRGAGRKPSPDVAKRRECIMDFCLGREVDSPEKFKRELSNNHNFRSQLYEYLEKESVPMIASARYQGMKWTELVDTPDDLKYLLAIETLVKDMKRYWDKINSV